jgi:hypothetical protein
MDNTKTCSDVYKNIEKCKEQYFNKNNVNNVNRVFIDEINKICKFKYFSDLLIYCKKN